MADIENRNMNDYDSNENVMEQQESGSGLTKLAAFGLGALGGGAVLLTTKVLAPIGGRIADKIEDIRDERQEKKEQKKLEREARREERKKRRKEKEEKPEDNKDKKNNKK